MREKYLPLPGWQGPNSKQRDSGDHWSITWPEDPNHPPGFDGGLLHTDGLTQILRGIADTSPEPIVVQGMDEPSFRSISRACPTRDTLDVEQRSIHEVSDCLNPDELINHLLSGQNATANAGSVDLLALEDFVPEIGEVPHLVEGEPAPQIKWFNSSSTSSRRSYFTS